MFSDCYKKILNKYSYRHLISGLQFVTAMYQIKCQISNKIMLKDIINQGFKRNKELRSGTRSYTLKVPVTLSLAVRTAASRSNPRAELSSPDFDAA